MKRRKKTTTGSSLLTAFGVLFLIAAGTAPAAPQKDRPKNAAAYAVVAGTVFREPGFSVPGAEVEIWPVAEPADRKVKKRKEIANSHGEFAFRVPPGPTTYNISAVAKGLHKMEKFVTVYGEERVDVTFMLAPSSNK